MLTSHRRAMTFVALGLLTSMLSPVIAVTGNQSPTTNSSTSDLESGIALYRSGDFKLAVKVLATAAKLKKDELSALHYLGLAFESLGKKSDAGKAHETAAELGSSLLEASLLETGGGTTKSLNPDTHEPLTQAAESAERYLALKPKLSKSNQEEWIYRAESLRYFADLTDPKNPASAQRLMFSVKEVDTKARVWRKPEPQYTQDARRNQVTGTIRLRAILTADGKVRGIFPVTDLPYGLTQMAIRAARGIRFDPAMKDGKPVSMFLLLEYNFNLY